MVNNRLRLWLVLLTLVILAILLTWQFGFQEGTGRAASHGVDDTLAQSKTAASVIANTNTCIQLPIQTGEGDFTPMDNALKCIVTEYASATGRKDKEKVLALDTELKELVYQTQSIRNHEAWKIFWKGKEQARYQYLTAIGIDIDDKGMRYDGGLRYDSILEARTEVRVWFEPFKPRFERIRTAFLAIPKTPEITNIENLYELDEQLEKLVAEARGKFSSYFPMPKYPEIGVYASYDITYTGAIRQVADKLLPPQGFIDPKTGKRIEVKGDRYSKLKGKLEEIYQTYKSLKQVREDAEKLYELSAELDKLVVDIRKAYPNSRSKFFWDDKYEPLGLNIGHYSDQLDYGGKLLVDSYRLDPDSRYSEITMVTAISGAGDMTGLSGVPDIDLAKRYLEKYPDGKYLKKIYWILATFYQNLYEEFLDSDKNPSTLSCYDEHLAAHPEDKDREAVRNKAIGYYKKLLAYEQSAPEEYKKALSNLENRIDGRTRYWCTD